MLAYWVSYCLYYVCPIWKGKAMTVGQVNDHRIVRAPAKPGSYVDVSVLLADGTRAGIRLEYIGGELYGALNVDNRNRDPEYSGIIRITPKAHLRVSGDFAVARVDGYLNARLPAEIHFPTGYIGADVDVSANIYAQALLWGKTKIF